MLLSLVGVAFATCFEPKQSVQTETQSRLEGEVRASVMAFSGGASAERETNATFAAQLASQEAIDNQWYLYYLCREFESGHLSRGQYCSVSAALWQRITGAPMSPDACLAEAAAAPAQAATVQAAPPTQSATGSPGRWVGLGPDGRPLEVYGPVDIAGTASLILDNRAGCLSALQESDGSWRETMLVGAQCAPWSELTVAQSPDRLLVTADAAKYAFEPVEGAFTTWDGTWTGAFYTERRTVGKALTSALVGGSAVAAGQVPITVSLDADGGQSKWPATGCRGTLTPDVNGRSLRVYREAVGPMCVNGATVTLRSLSADSVLIEWLPPSGGGTKALGVLHRSAEP